MINDNTILSSFDDRPTLLEWLKKVEDALKTDTAKSISVENPSANTYVFKITFADGDSISSGNVVFPDSVKDVSIKNGHIIVTQISGTQTDLGAINPYADTIVVNAETNTTEIGNNVEVGGDLSVQGSVVGRGIVTSIGRLTANGGIEVHGQGYVNGALGVTGNATIGGTITAGGKAIKAVEANPTGEATETLEKVKIGDVAYNVGGGGGGSNDREITLILPYPKTDDTTTPKKIYVNDDIYSKITNCYYETIKIYFQDGDPLGIFQLFHYKDKNTHFDSADYISTIYSTSGGYSQPTWYGSDDQMPWFARLYKAGSDSHGKYIFISGFKIKSIPILSQSKFDALYKLADKPTQDGNYILKASVSGGVVTYTWELQQ